MKSKKLGIYGPYPPPRGGVSVHIERLETYLKENNIDYVIHNFGYYSSKQIVATNKSVLWYFKLLFKSEYSVFHFHLSFLWEIIFYFIYSFLKRAKIIVTIHNDKILGVGCLRKKILIMFIRMIPDLKLIVVSSNTRDFFNKKGIDCEYLPAYVPPIVTKPQKLNVSKKMFLFSVWRLTRDNAINIYNVPLAMELLQIIKDDYDMLFLIGDEDKSDKFFIEELLDKYQVRDNVLALYNRSLVDYLCNCDFLIRTNIVDGYGVSLQEAMDLGVPAVASDVCKRPRGTILFRNNDIVDLEEKIRLIINCDVSKLLEEKENLHYHLRLISIYKRYLGA